MDLCHEGDIHLVNSYECFSLRRDSQCMDKCVTLQLLVGFFLSHEDRIMIAFLSEGESV